MRLSSILTAALAAAVPVTVLACEGECIVKITNAFVGNYTDSVNRALDAVAQQISSMLSRPDVSTCRSYLEPIVTAYDNGAYNGMETAIFPHFFHGKCEQNGVDPPGCPNPDCPVICGTPGSMVHFYSKLRYIAFNQTSSFMQALATPGSDAYMQVEQNVLNAANEHARSISRIFPREVKGASKTSAGGKRTPKTHGYNTAPVSPGPSAGSGPGSIADTGYGSSAGDHIFVPVFARGSREDIISQLRVILQQFPVLLGEFCGDDGTEGSANSLSNCSWEGPMKTYILTFP